MTDKPTLPAKPPTTAVPTRRAQPTRTNGDPLAAALKILGVKPENVIASNTRDNGDFVVVVNQGQKFVFTPDELFNPKAARARLRAEGLKVIAPLDPTRRANARPNDGLPED
jgi:hypothetical protein